MNIGIDFHGVTEKYPEIMKPLMSSFIKNGGEHEIFIISGPPYIEIVESLTKAQYIYGIHYDQVISVVDWIKRLGFVEMKQHKDKSWYCEDEVWWASKAAICREYHISILIDDKLEYKKHIKNNFPLFFHVG